MIQNRFLTTKFHMPSWRENGVPRPLLMERLDSGLRLNHKLTLISAPAGYGKTTLVSEWIRKLSFQTIPETRIGWLSLDTGDNDPARFLRYFITAVQQIDADLGQSALSLLGMPQLPPLSSILDEFINEIAVIEYRIVLILDDYHVINNSELHELIEYLLEHQPAQIHLVITSRADPPFPLARLRVRAQITEIRAHDLRFNQQESLQFFNQSMFLNLDANTVRLLDVRTEGWAAGLQLAALAMQNLPDQTDFVSGFSGSHRYIIDYLIDEVLKNLPPEITDFLSKTALLQRFNAAACQAVSGNPNAAEILDQLERSNLFLIPLDNQRNWFRYHHLFADVLQINLSKESEKEIRQNAARWFESQGLVTEAISYWLSAPDLDQAARLIGQAAIGLIRNGELQTLLNWLNAIPEERIKSDPDLASYKTLSLLFTGQINRVKEFAGEVFQSTSTLKNKAGQGRWLAMQAWMANTSADARTKELARAALDHLDPSDLFFRAVSLIALGTSYAWENKLAYSSDVFREAYQIGRQLDHPFITMGALANLAFNLLETGSLQEAEALCCSALEEFTDSRGKPLPILGILYGALASIYFEEGNFKEAEKFAQLGISLCQRLFSSAIAGGDNEFVLAHVNFYNGNIEQAVKLLNTTADAARKNNIMMVVFKMTVLKAEFSLLQADIPQSQTQIEVLNGFVQALLPKSERIVAHLKARLLLLMGQTEPALEIIEQIEKEGLETGNSRRLLGLWITRSLAYQKLGNEVQALQSFTEALKLAAPQGYRSVFIPFTGRPTQKILQAARSTAPDFVDQILQHIPQLEENEQPLIDPLSAQELKILNLIVAGKSNREISEELFITIGTAKWHVHNILQKLGVNNRPQAIARAHELGLG